MPADLSWAWARSPTGRRCNSQATLGPAGFPSAVRKSKVAYGLGAAVAAGWGSMRPERKLPGPSYCGEPMTRQEEQRKGARNSSKHGANDHGGKTPAQKETL